MKRVPISYKIPKEQYDYYIALTEFFEEYLKMSDDFYVRIIDKRDLLNEIYVIAPQYVKRLVEYLIAEGVFTINELRETFFKEKGFVLNFILNNENMGGRDDERD